MQQPKERTKLLVFSDTHGQAGRMLEVVKREGPVDGVLFLGDGAKDADQLQLANPRLPLYRVQGNCDFSSFDPESGLLPFDGNLFFYTHGHNYNVKYGLGELWRTAYVNGACAALFGHTHLAHCEQREGIYLFNPGSLTLPRSGGPTYGRITLEDGKPFFEIRPY